jgi:hypothetical protein
MYTSNHHYRRQSRHRHLNHIMDPNLVARMQQQEEHMQQAQAAQPQQQSPYIQTSNPQVQEQYTQPSYTQDPNMQNQYTQDCNDSLRQRTT